MDFWFSEADSASFIAQKIMCGCLCMASRWNGFHSNGQKICHHGIMVTVSLKNAARGARSAEGNQPARVCRRWNSGIKLLASRGHIFQFILPEHFQLFLHKLCVLRNSFHVQRIEILGWKMLSRQHNFERHDRFIKDQTDPESNILSSHLNYLDILLPHQRCEAVQCWVNSCADQVA